MVKWRFSTTTEKNSFYEGGEKTWYRWKLYRGKQLVISGSEDTPEKAKEAAKKQFLSKKEYYAMDGEEFYRKLQQAFAYKDGNCYAANGQYQWEASRYLQDKGLVGIKYLNGVGQGYNYVIFDGDNVDIEDIDHGNQSK